MRCSTRVGLSRLWHVAGRRRIVSAPQAAAFAGAFVVAARRARAAARLGVATNLPAHMVQHVLLLAVVRAACSPRRAVHRRHRTRSRRACVAACSPTWRGCSDRRSTVTGSRGRRSRSRSANLTLAHVAPPGAVRRRGAQRGRARARARVVRRTATLFWWMVLGAGRRERRGLGVLGVFVATLPATALGVLMTLAATPWYAPYGSDAHGGAQPAGRRRGHVGIRRAGARGRGARRSSRAGSRHGPGRRPGPRPDAPDRWSVVIKRLGRWFDDRLGASRFAAHRRSTRSSPTTGRSCWARSRCTASSSSSSPACTSRFFFVPSDEPVVYHGSYGPLRGTTMSQAYESTVRLSFDVRAGLVMRQIHHWAALLFLAAIVAHLCRIFFTGAFRRPRELNWFVGVTLLVLAIFNGFAGYSLPDDLLSGTGPAHRVLDRARRSRSSAPGWRSCVFGGEFPARDILPPVRHPHPARAGRDRRPARRPPRDPLASEAHAVPRPRPDRAQRRRVASCGRPTPRRASACSPSSPACSHCSAGSRRSTRCGSTVPSTRPRSRTAAQPDWYLGWIEGALRIVPPVLPPHRSVQHLRAVLARGRVAGDHVRAPAICGPSSNAASRTTPPSTTCSTGRATARCARPSGSGS